MLVKQCGNIPGFVFAEVNTPLVLGSAVQEEPVDNIRFSSLQCSTYPDVICLSRSRHHFMLLFSRLVTFQNGLDV